jgi:hypothetical protein
LNQRPLGYEPNELPDCSTPHFDTNSGGKTWSNAEQSESPRSSEVIFIPKRQPKLKAIKKRPVRRLVS